MLLQCSVDKVDKDAEPDNIIDKVVILETSVDNITEAALVDKLVNLVHIVDVEKERGKAQLIRGINWL